MRDSIEARKKFRQLAQQRTEEAIKRIRKIGSLGGSHRYDYTDADAQDILQALQTALKELEQHLFPVQMVFSTEVE